MTRLPGSLEGLSSVLQRTRSALWLRAADRVGPGATLVGRPHVVNRGRLEIGGDFRLSSTPALSHLVVGEGAKLSIGDGVSIAHGAAVSALKSVEIRDGARLGAYVVIMDSDFHVVGDRDRHGESTPVVIGPGARIGHRVTILRGSTIGAGASVASGSVVSGLVPDGVTVFGVPARARSSAASAGAESVAAVAARIFGLAELPSPGDGPESIKGWDSLGALRLLLALEESFGITLGEAELKSARTIEGLERVVQQALER